MRSRFDLSFAVVVTLSATSGCASERLPDPVRPGHAVAPSAEWEWSSVSARQHSGVRTLDFEWHDEERDRPVPVRIRIPLDVQGPCPVVVISHGLGGTREHYAYLGHFLAENGYVVIHLQHAGSDDSVWKDERRRMRALRKAARDVDEITARPKDVSFALDQAEQLNTTAEGPLARMLDFDRVAVAGHSFGAYTALAASGRVLVPARGEAIDLRDPRIKACIAMSAPAKSRDAKSGAYSSFSIPCLHMTGTKDSSPIGETSAKERRIPFDAIHHGDQYLLTFTGGDHMVFSGRRLEEPAPTPPSPPRGKLRQAVSRKLQASRKGDPVQEARFQQLIKDATLAFLEAHLNRNDAAKRWLADGGFATQLGADGTWEAK